MTYRQITREQFVEAVEKGIAYANEDALVPEPDRVPDLLREQARNLNEVVAMSYYDHKHNCGCPAVEANVLDQDGNAGIGGKEEDWIHLFTMGFDNWIGKITGADRSVLVKVTD
jgi:hypothetical protein